LESVSIVILSLMRLDHTRRCVDALYRHTQQPFDLIIVDMGVDDEVCSFLEELAQQRENVRIVFNAENVGTTRGRNQGAALAQGDWLVFLDNDAEVTEGWREALLGGASEPNVGACAPRLLSPRGNVLVAPPSLISIEEGGNVSKIGWRMHARLLHQRE
jgi:GT2 family glycosyltransferase